MDRYFALDVRDVDADMDIEALVAQDPVWVPPEPEIRPLSATRRDFIKGVIASADGIPSLH